VSGRNARGGARRLAVAGLALVAVACSTATVRHTVRPGESLTGIARHYGVPYEDLVRANRIRDPARLAVGRELRIPGAKTPVVAAPRTPTSGTMPIGYVPGAPEDGDAFRWPVADGAVTSPFGRRDADHHDGIDIQAPTGSVVHAAQAGRVIYSASLRGYGNLVIVDHGGGLATVYAHNQRNLVRAGARVSAGQPIARLGATGRTTAPHLHFEVRKDNVARDPLAYLPPMSVASRRPQGRP
jgi:murein DD-endopeptidase MepM/ murein hydrolase activator NlpD